MNSTTLSSSIRTIASDKLLRTIASNMYGTLTDLFVDWNAKDKPTNLLEDKKEVMKSLRFMHCQSLNDERTIEFHQRFKQDSYVFDETRQIWIDEYIDPIEDDMFMPRDDAQ